MSLGQLSMSIYCGGKVECLCEYPDNSYQLELDFNGVRVTLWLQDHLTWWNLRRNFARAKSYYFYDQRTVLKGEAAEAAAHRIHAEWLARQAGVDTPPLAPAYDDAEPVF